MKKVTAAISILLSSIIIVCEFYMIFTLGSIKKTSLPDNNAELGITPTLESEDTTEKYTDLKNKGTSSIENTPTPTPEVKTDDAKVENILLFGVDRRGTTGNSRSDTIIVVSIDRKNKAIKITSFMRDMYVPIPGRKENRINAAYAFGGPKLAIKTINSDFGLDVRNFITVDFSSFKEIIDLIGGVQINVKANEVPYCGVKKSGLQKLNGEQTLAYARIRHTGNADYERTERQRRVLNEIFKKLKSVDVFSLTRIINKAASCAETSLSNAQILSLAMDVYKLDVNTLQEFRLPVNGCYRSASINGMSVLVPDIEKNKKLLHEFIYPER